ncbi:unnamed protein product [Cylicocyclus nassatus]|uniref:Uncharacterized protein n=1 Tax=Cylicocyclus nassatus TaxID=53992 RepID=A0AA36DV99_CYLNA|nr:unnamed protein product [Cylicocyclus nassatus]
MYGVAFPLLYLELALGQYTHSSVLSIFDRIAPIGFGIGVSALWAVLMSVIIGSYFQEVVLTLFYASFDLFTTELAYDNCVGRWCRANCQKIKRRCEELGEAGHLEGYSYSEDFDTTRHSYIGVGDTCVHNEIKYWNKVYTDGQGSFIHSLPELHFSHAYFENYTTLELYSWPHVSSLASAITAACAMAYILSLRRRWVAYIAYIYMSLMFTVTVSIVVIYAYMDPPDYPTSHVFEKPLKFFNTETWLTAIIMACLCLRLGYGGMIYLGSQNSFHNNVQTDAMVITIIVSFIYVSQAMLHALVRDAFLLEAMGGDHQVFLATVQAANDFTLKSNRAGTKLIALFAASFETFRNMHAPLVMLLAVFGFFSALIRKMICVDVIYTALMDYWSFVQSKDIRSSVIILICLCSTVLGFISYCVNCFVIDISMETIVLPNVTCILILAELFVVCGLYGTRRFSNNISTMIEGKLSAIGGENWVNQITGFITMAMLKAVIPVAILYALITYMGADRTNMQFYDVMWQCVLLSPIGICAIIKVAYFYRHRMSYWRLFMPDTELWGPRATANRLLAEKNEKLVRY